MIKMLSPGIAERAALLIAPNDSPSTSARTRPPMPSMAAERRDPPACPTVQSREARLADLASHLEMLWRFACRMGASAATAEDVAQEAFVIAASRLDAIVEGKERSYLVSVVVHLVRRDRVRGARHEPFEDVPDHRPEHADQRLDDERARNLLDRALDSLEDDLRAVFVLHEIEEETMAEIAILLELPPGTVASRLRRAREEWKRATTRLKCEWETKRTTRAPSSAAESKP